MNALSRSSHYTRIASVTFVCLVINTSPLAQAGWTGSMNGTGFGKASVNVTSSTLNASTITSAAMSGPSAAMTTTAGYSAGGPLPPGSSPATVSRILGQPGYVWKSNTTASNGDKADNATLSPYVTPTSPRASTTFEVLSATVDPNGCGPGQANYTFTWHWTGTDAGTAQMVRFYEYHGVIPNDPSFNGDVSTLPWAIQRGRGVLIFGSCGYYQAGNNSLNQCNSSFDNIHTESFCATSDISKIYMVTDGIAVSTPCPQVITFNGFQSPIGGADSTGGNCYWPKRQFTVGSTIPVNMTLLRQCDGAPITTGNHTIQVSRCNPPATITPNPNLFYVSGFNGEWQYNLNTSALGMTAGNWKLTVTLSDGQVHVVHIGLLP